MAVVGSALPFESEEIWEKFKGEADDEAGESCWTRLSAWFGGGHWASIDEDEEEGDTEVVGCVVGIPTLFGPPNSSGHAIFEELVQASEVAIDLINTDAMRAAIAFKCVRAYIGRAAHAEASDCRFFRVQVAGLRQQ